MGKISMKAVQQQVFNLNKSGEKSMAYVLRPTRYSTIDAKQIVEYCAQNSMVPKAYISGAMVALSQCITNFLLNGHHVVFPDLGTFSLTSTGYAEGNVDKAGLDQLKKLNVRFLPCKDLKNMVDNVDVELDGVFDIAGETILAEATIDSDAKTQKYYKRVNRTITVDSEGNETTGGGSTPSGGNSTPSGGNSNPSSGDTTPQTYTLNISSANTTQGTVNTSANKAYNAGTVVNITATPKSGYTFDKWSDDNTSASRSVAMNKDLSLVASFKAVEPATSAVGISITSINNQPDGGHDEVNVNAELVIRGTGLQKLTAANFVHSEGKVGTYVANSDGRAVLSYEGVEDNEQTVSVVVGGETLFILNFKGNSSYE